MKKKIKLYITRHGKSIACESAIIQGSAIDTGLSRQGIKETKQFARKHKELFSGLRGIITSPAKRARQKANIISEVCGLKVQEDPLLQEFNAGILHGLTKEEAKARYPKYFEIWCNRGDLNGIPGAETGDELQARVLLFLDRYRTNMYTGELIISHAGFIRSMINTITLTKRDSPVNVDYSSLHCIENPLNKIVRERVTGSIRSRVDKIKTIDKEYILKKTKKKSETFYSLQKEVSWSTEIEGIIPRILCDSQKNNKRHNIQQVMDFMMGEQRFGSLHESEFKHIMSSVYTLHTALKNISPNYTGIYSETLEKEIQNKIINSPSQKISQIGNQILCDPPFSEMIREKQILVHDDINRSNVLFSEKNVKIIDIDHILFAPEEYQLGSFFASNLQLESPQEFQLEEAIKAWPEKKDPLRVLAMMNARAFLGISFFAKEYKRRPSQENSQFLQRYFQSLEQNQKIKRQFSH